VVGACACRAAPTRRSTTTGRAANRKSASSATHASRRASRRCARKRVWGASVIWASSSMTPMASRGPPASRTNRTCTRRSSQSSLIRKIPTSLSKRVSMGYRRLGSKPPDNRQFGRWRWSGRSPSPCIPSTARCRWSGMCRRFRPSNRRPRPARWAPMAACRTCVHCAFPSSTSPICSPRAMRSRSRAGSSACSPCAPTCGRKASMASSTRASPPRVGLEAWGSRTYVPDHGGDRQLRRTGS
jgi:hypothetical protein